ncbi:hypothetical protein FKW77_002345 [Venturia effusa]|uniref:RNA polymerase I-specific transcription initiation factor RRN6-like protein n=1 Tax=Venturia effusa TaxID=50376 RepID=A0A517LAH5_9PEZI|nr:hypothetical protein FKW77_002345 [Venturia effusa]
MVKTTLADQSYGHFGTPVYDVQRDVRRTISGTKNVEEEEKSTETEVNESMIEESGLTKEIRSLVKEYPELQVAEDILYPLLHASEAVTAAIARYDPAAGDILAFGTAAVSDGQNRHYKTKLLAIPGGECGQMLRLIRLKVETYGWDEHESRLMVPLPTKEIGWWIGKGAPILQICTPEILSQEDTGSFLAVRLPGTTLIFRPRYRSSPVPPAGIHLGCMIPPSRVDANLSLEITRRDWEGQQHADVTFDPWNQRRMAIVDQAGDWAILKLQREHEGKQTFVYKLGHRGSLDGLSERSETRKCAPIAQQDGWARILWVADKNTLLVCTRRRFQLFSLSAETALPFTSFLSKNQWILDVKRCSAMPTWLFVLTSTQILWLEILPELDRGSDITTTTGKILLSAHHFRDPSDISLQMSLENQLDVISVMLWSRSSPMVTCVRLDRQESVTGLPSMTGSPAELLLPVVEKGKALRTSALSFLRLEYEPGAMDSAISMHSLQLLTDDLALHHGFLSSSNSAVPVNAPHQIASARTHSKIAPMMVDEDDDFLVPDELSQKRPLSRTKKRKAHKVEYGSAIHSKISNATKQEGRQEILNIANNLRGLILDEDVQSLGEPAKTLLELALSPIPEVGELAETSQALSNLSTLSRPGLVPDEGGVAVTKLQIPTWASPMGVHTEELEFSDFYNHIIQQQLVPLVNVIPPRFRMGREKLARQIAAEVILSSSRVQVMNPPQETQDQDEMQQSFFLQGGKGKARATGLFPASSQLSEYMSSQTLPTPSPSASRAASTIMSGTTASLPSAASQNIISRLSRHVSFTPSNSSWATRPMTLLAHWDIGADPSTYNYTAKLDDVERQKQEESMTDKQRRKAQEKAERRLKRQRREAEKARGALMSSQPVVMSSQVHRGGNLHDGSQYSAGSQYGGGSQYGRSSPPLPSSPPPVLDRERERNFAMSSQLAVPPIVGSSQLPIRRGDGPTKRKKAKRVGF